MYKFLNVTYEPSSNILKSPTEYKSFHAHENLNSNLKKRFTPKILICVGLYVSSVPHREIYK